MENRSRYCIGLAESIVIRGADRADGELGAYFKQAVLWNRTFLFTQ